MSLIIKEMIEELTAYLVAAQGVTFNHSGIDQFTTDVLAWWRNHTGMFPS